MLRYTYINKSIETASIANDACTMTSDEKIPVSVNTYNAVAPAIRVTYSCVVDGNTVLPETQLTQNTDWNWSGMAKLPADCKGKRIFITAKALFNNGETQDAEGYLYAIDSQTGKLKWDKKMDVAGLPVLVDGLTAANGIVYAGSGKAFGAYNGKTGDAVWLNKGWPQGEATTSTPLLANGVVISGANWRGFYGNDAQTGELLWKLDKDGITDRGATPAYDGNLLYVTSRQSLFIIDCHSGEVIVRKELPFNVQVNSTPLVTDKLIVFGTQTDGLVALDRETFEVRWKARTSPALVYTAPYSRHPAATVETSPLLIGDTIYFGASDGIIYGIDKESGQTTWKHKTGAPLFSTLSTNGNMIFATDFGGNVYAFKCNE